MDNWDYDWSTLQGRCHPTRYMFFLVYTHWIPPVIKGGWLGKSRMNGMLTGDSSVNRGFSIASFEIPKRIPWYTSWYLVVESP